MMRIWQFHSIITLILGVICFSNAQTKEYIWFIPDHDVITSSFGEFRVGHYHAGIDIRANSGTPIVAPANGWIRRVTVTPWGYGKVLYFSFEDTFTAVYAHLSSFAEPMLSRVINTQYSRKSFCTDIWFSKFELFFHAGETLGYTGGTGAGSPHLHFEVRKNDSMIINPVFIGITTPDNLPPKISAVSINPLDCITWIEEGLLPFQISNGSKFWDTDKAVRFWGKIGLAVSTYDLAVESSQNRLGPFKLSLMLNDSMIFSCEYDSFLMSQTRTIGFMYDSEHEELFNKRFHRLYCLGETDNMLLANLPVNAGIIDASKLQSERIYNLSVVIEDLMGHIDRCIIKIIPTKPKQISLKYEPMRNGKYKIIAENDSNNAILHYITPAGSIYSEKILTKRTYENREGGYYYLSGSDSVQFETNFLGINGSLSPVLIACSLFTVAGQFHYIAEFDIPPQTTPKFEVGNIPAICQMIQPTRWLIRQISDPDRTLVPIIRAKIDNFYTTKVCRYSPEMYLVRPKRKFSKTLNSENWAATIDVPENAVIAPSPMIVFLEPSISDAFVSDFFHFDPHTTYYYKRGTLTFEPRAGNTIDEDELRKICVARLWLGKIYRQSSRRSGRTITCAISAPGTFILLVDNEPPVITLKSRAEISFYVSDNFSGFGKGNLPEIYIDDLWELAEYDADNVVLIATPREPLSSGEHNVRVLAIDRAGNVSEKEFTINVR